MQARCLTQGGTRVYLGYLLLAGLRCAHKPRHQRPHFKEGGSNPFCIFSALFQTKSPRQESLRLGRKGFARSLRPGVHSSFTHHSNTSLEKHGTNSTGGLQHPSCSGTLVLEQLQETERADEQLCTWHAGSRRGRGAQSCKRGGNELTRGGG